MPEGTIDWDLCILCQNDQSKEKLSCPAAMERKNHDPGKAYNELLINLHRFAELRSLPFEKVYLSDNHFNKPSILLEQKAKFHRTCSLKINNMKLGRLEKSIEKAQAECQHEEEEQTETESERRRSDRINKPDAPEAEKKTIVLFLSRRARKAASSNHLQAAF